ncbi:MAG: Vacuolar H+transporting two-sector ATPase F subunit [Candidatus Parvarchaeum acidophilus ARMAN-5]|jgi:vacuolar-type H+-ATPase subunit F/Vma7|uniref:Vacuolar H+transporting two-sector ATPase F subunit n=1 Tax=Candidatus Parvarchaeum acidophilus ARMAN-5 TaxID=662762 RepID=D6GVY6_PARA5|nr:MAG: Vacuolar H+transporting two-sector ATPase F subunit [Candidatus Parvarchaeum acidophilus ARMAN-5]EFD92605.1 MAG: Vacuolar H+transporting two-sector ATPase F subunit [Candidatus Parvarchaeum acidophilus ARMAN-5]
MEFKKIVFVGNREDSLGLQLAGIDKVIPASGNKALEEVIKLIKGKEYNLIIAEEDIKEYANQNESNIINTSVDPLVLLIPSKEMEENGESLESLAKRVLGVDITKLK